MAIQYVDKKHLGTLASPTEITDSAANRQFLSNRPEAAGITYDRASGTLKFNGGDAIRTLESNKGRSYTPTAAGALTADQSGMDVFLNAAAGFAITLPAVAVGLKYRVTVAAAFATTDFTVITPGGANLIQGGAMVDGADVAASDEDTITFVASAENKGDFVDLWSDGTSWFVHGRGTAAGSITFTAS